ncbi:MFS transporter [Streptomonospora litoralis]|uniref:Putative sulfoacetate transporter SauU n=1 Tax=Streptomonospora litoralis TaxID=2498135 RepID=A0A4V0ZJ12_9ACTN|nr:MFS transporter [Streptomonospora litoralis]QBI51872.1 putative sulfoacetate transporter SauU [Streptomonospora litoralis]
MALRTAAQVGDRQFTPGSPRAWTIVAMLVVLMALNYADKLAFGLAATPIIDEFGLTLDEFGLAGSAFYLPFFITTLIVGFAADRVGSTRPLGAIAVLWGVAQLSMVAATGLGVILFSRLLLGASEGPTYGLVNHSAFSWLKESDRNLASSLLSAGGSIGVMIGAPVLTWLIVDHGWRSAFLYTGLASIAWCLAWFFIGREGPLSNRAPAASRATDEAPDTAETGAEGAEEAAAGTGSGAAAPAGPDASAAAPAHRIPSILRIIATPTFLAVSLAAFAGNWAIAVNLNFKPLYAEHVLNMTEQQISVFIVVGQLFITAAVYIGLGTLMKSLMGRGYSGRVSRGVLGGVCVVAAGVAFIGFVYAPGLYPRLACSVIGGIGLIAFPVGSTVIAQMAPVERRAGALGTYAAIYGLAGVIAPWFTGLVAEQAETQAAGLDNAFIFWGALTIVCGVVALVFTRPERDGRRLAAAAGGGGPAKSR